MFNNLDFLQKFETEKEFQIPFLKSSFEDNIWSLELNKTKKQNTVIDFNIPLKDGVLLTHTRNYKTLYTFKKLIMNLFYLDEMYLNSEATILARLYGILHLFNLINFYDDGSFAKNGFKSVDKDQLLFLFNKKLHNPILFDLYSGQEKLASFLESEGIKIPANLTNADILQIEKLLKTKNIDLQKALFPNLFLGVQFSLSNVLLNKVNHKYIREYSSYFRNDETSSHSVDSTIQNLLTGIKLMNKMHSDTDHNCSLPFKSELEFILNYNFNGKEIKHFETYPVESIFKIMQSCLDFHFEYGKDITKSFCSFLNSIESDGLSNNKLKIIIDKNYLDNLTIKSSSSKLKSLGVSCYYMETNENYFKNIRANKSLLSLLKVYYGCVQFVVGALMARRQSEISSMEIGCFDESNLQLSFRKSKSYIHSFGIRDYISLPTTEVVIDMLKNINEIAKKLNNNESNKLFVFPNTWTPWNAKRDKHNFYENLDTLFDYLEVDLINDKRPYIRQHQLRRFFAMAFFWSKGFKSIDTLRWFLGHTNAEHVYHYIQENLDGQVMNNVKAQYITENIENHNNLKELLKTKFGVVSYDMIDKDDLADYVNTLLENKLITVEPEFLDDDKNNQFEIIVKVKNHG
ncbi:MAG: site-specific integrase [Candidatus Sericytochromatia bacterium]|nr:site-specific integrase [Candidatus Sericytochromatia bacterium]